MSLVWTNIIYILKVLITSIADLAFLFDFQATKKEENEHDYYFRLAYVLIQLYKCVSF